MKKKAKQVTATVTTVRVPCGDSKDRDGKHAVVVGADEEGHLTHLSCECSAQLSDATTRLGGNSCGSLVVVIRKWVSTNSGWGTPDKLPKALTWLEASEAAKLRQERAKNKPKGVEPETDRYAALATKWASRASGLGGLITVGVLPQREVSIHVVAVSYALTMGCTVIAAKQGRKWLLNEAVAEKVAADCDAFNIGDRFRYRILLCPVCGVIPDAQSARSHCTKKAHVAKVINRLRLAIMLLNGYTKRVPPSTEKETQ